MPLPDANASDWSELDLLMVADAVERLDEERAALGAEINQLAAAEPPDPTALASAHRRMDLLERSRARAEKVTVVIEPGRVRTRAEIAETPGPPD
jgi:hypothetical protein